MLIDSKSSISISTVVFAFLIAFRVFCSKSDSLYVFVAFICLVALDYVIFTLSRESFNFVNNLLTESVLPVSQKKNKRRKLISILVFSYSFIIITEIIYAFKFNASLGNDIISFVALYFSIEYNWFYRKLIIVFENFINI